MSGDVKTGAPALSAEFQGWLDRMGDAVLAGDFGAYAAGVALPFNLITQGGSLAVATPDELRRGFDEFVAVLQSQSATKLIRVADAVFPIGEELMAGHYETHILRGGAHVFPAFHSMAILRSGETGWQAVAICNGMKNSRWPIGLPRIDPEAGEPA